MTGLANVAALLTPHAQARPEDEALVEPAGPGRARRVVRWADFDDRVTRLATGLAELGLVAGHRVALLGGNSIEYVLCYLAALRAGFVVVPINVGSSADELERILTHSGARVLITDAPERGIDGVPTVVLSEDGLAALPTADPEPLASPPDPESLAVLLYTAGTSGDPKAAMLSHRALLAHCAQVSELGLVTSADTVLLLLPLFHVFGLNAVLGSGLAAGARIVIMDGLAEDVLGAVAAEGVTNLPLAPSAIFRLLSDDRCADALSGVSTVISGAAPLPTRLADEFRETTGLRVEQGYGLTEAAPGVSTTHGADLLGPGHVGRPLPGVEVRIGDGSDDSEPARIHVRGTNLFSGYWPDGAGGPDEDGWIDTGDVGYRTGDDLFLVDRARELIIVSGFNVYPAEIEDVISELPPVGDVAVIGQPHLPTGEQVVAFVTGDVTEEQVRTHVAARLARFKQPSAVHLVDELPRGATGKIRKGALRDLLDPTGSHGEDGTVEEDSTVGEDGTVEEDSTVEEDGR